VLLVIVHSSTSPRCMTWSTPSGGASAARCPVCSPIGRDAGTVAVGRTALADHL
jgi:hypothetical protein